MTAQQLIEELEGLVDAHGDCIVTLNGNDREVVTEVRMYDADGDMVGRVVEFSIWSEGS